ncbi:SulP family inorganic anion transporter, partial [Streptomyces caniscabiei]|uniref:SulP family inorganic anion transporter n=1 Tax=Streptomyces caniscabiei TaxID=2746961 RepID=UPI00234FFF77
RTRYNTELIAQGAGNTVAGVLGALPITAVVARSSANVQAGAKTRLSRTLHGLWLLAFALLLPQVLALIPISVLAGVLVHSGWKLFAPEQFPKMWRQDRGEFAVMTLTTLVITVTALLEGVLFGLAAGVVLAALRMSQTVVRQHIEDDTAKVVMAGNATFLRLPKLIDALEGSAAVGNFVRSGISSSTRSPAPRCCATNSSIWLRQAWSRWVTPSRSSRMRGLPAAAAPSSASISLGSRRNVALPAMTTFAVSSS